MAETPVEMLSETPPHGSSPGTLANDTIIMSARDAKRLAMDAILPGDANRDRAVDDADDGTLARNWQKQTAATWSEGDFNGDGKVTDDDAAILAQHWMMAVEDMKDDDDDARDSIFATIGAEGDGLEQFDQ